MPMQLPLLSLSRPDWPKRRQRKKGDKLRSMPKSRRNWTLWRPSRLRKRQHGKRNWRKRGRQRLSD